MFHRLLCSPVGRRVAVVLVAAGVVGLSGCSVFQRSGSGGASRTGAATVPDIERFVKMHWPTGVSQAPDGTVYFIKYDDAGVRQLFRMAPDAGQPDAVKLTDFTDGVGGYALSDDGARMAVLAAEGGSEQNNIYLVEPKTGTIRGLFVDPKVVYEGVVWRRDSRAFAYRANDASPADFHIYVYDYESGTSRKVLSEPGFYYPADFNRDGSKLVVGRFHSASHSQLFEITLGTGEIREITPRGEAWAFSPIGYNATDSHFLVSTDYRGDLKNLHAIDLRTGEVAPLVPELARYEVDSAQLNEDRTVLALVTNEDGYGTLHLYRTIDFAPQKVPMMDRGVVGNVAFQDRYMLFSLENANTPGIVYRWDLNAPAAPPVAVTQADTQGIDVSRFRLPELVWYPSFDGTLIPAFLYLPEGHRPGKKIPFIVHYHGGPEAQFRPTFNRSFQYFLSRGYGVLAPNVRGSSGYGKAYLEADNYKNRYVSVRDGVWAARYLVDAGYARPRRVAAWGGSYGGFMTMAVITEAPEIFGAACNVVGIVNFKTFLEQTRDYRRALREAEYGPLSDPEFLASISPINMVDRIDTPLLVVHGLNDPRVPVGEAMQIAVELIRRNRTVEQLYFPDEGHGFAKQENQLIYFRTVANFLDRHLKRG